MEPAAAGMSEDRITFNCVSRAVAAWMAACDTDRTGPAARLAASMRDIVRKCQAGELSEIGARTIETTLAGLIDDLYHPLGEDAERVARRTESDADRAEDAAQDVAAIEGQSAFALEEHARRLDLQAASSRRLARVLRQKARALRTERARAIAVTKDRLGLSNLEIEQ